MKDRLLGIAKSAATNTAVAIKTHGPSMLATSLRATAAVAKPVAVEGMKSGLHFSAANPVMASLLGTAGLYKMGVNVPGMVG